MKLRLVVIACVATVLASTGAVSQVSQGKSAPPPAKAPAKGPKTITATAPAGGLITGGGLQCGAVCTATSIAGEQGIFSADPAVGFVFDSWEGTCKGQSEVCSVVVSDNITLSARFRNIGIATLTISPPPVEGDVSATYLSGTPAGVSCKAGQKLACSAKFTKGTDLKLRASDVSSGYKFGGWTGVCAGRPATCQITMDKDHTISGMFAR